MITYLTAKFGAWFAALGAICMAVLYAFTRGRSQGKAVATQKITHDLNKQADKLDQKLQQVDNRPVDFNAAAERLRQRAKQGGTPK